MPKRVQATKSGPSTEPEQKIMDTTSSLRPISLLNKMRQMLERIVPNKINTHLSNTGPDISDNQFGFLGPSTICAIENAIKYAQSVIFHTTIATAVSV